jgi:hypothetical protein
MHDRRGQKHCEYGTSLEQPFLYESSPRIENRSLASQKSKETIPLLPLFHKKVEHLTEGACGNRRVPFLPDEQPIQRYSFLRAYVLFQQEIGDYLRCVVPWSSGVAPDFGESIGLSAPPYACTSRTALLPSSVLRTHSTG